MVALALLLLHAEIQAQPIPQVMTNIDEVDIQLVNGSAPNEGRVLIRWSPDSPWTAVCNNPSFSHAIPFQMCRRLGYPFACGHDFAGPHRTDNASLANVTSERHLVSCAADLDDWTFGGCSLHPISSVDPSIGPAPCIHDNDMWLTCGYSGMPDFQLRLVEGATYPLSNKLLQGRCGAEHEWSALCGNIFHRLKQGRVACRELGHSDQAINTAHVPLDVLEPEHRPNYTLFVDIGCVGNETSLSECHHYALRDCQFYVTLECFTEVDEFDEPGYLCGSKQVCGDQCNQIHPISDSGDDVFHYCQCDDACSLFDDCCYDYEGTCSPGALTLERGEFTIEDFGCVWLPGSQFTHIGYALIDHCPITWTDPGTRDLCHRPVDLRDVIGSLPVYDEQGVDFKNIYCAICHGRSLDKLKRWDVSGSDNDRDSTVPLLYPSLNQTLPSKGWVISPPLGHEAIRKCPAHLTDICFEQYRGTPTDAGCQAYYAPVKLEDSNIRYRNPHCAMCNGRNIVPDNSCRDQVCLEGCDPSPWGPCWAICSPYDSFITIEVLFDLFSSSSIGGRTCSGGQIYDPFLEICRVLICAPGYRIRQNECVPAPTGPSIFGNSSNVLVAICLLNKFAQNSTAKMVVERGNIHATSDSTNSTWQLAIFVNTVDEALEVEGDLEDAIGAFQYDSKLEMQFICNVSSFSIFVPFSVNAFCADSVVDGKGIFPEYNGTLLTVTEYKYTPEEQQYLKLNAPPSCLKIFHLNCSSLLSLDNSEYKNLSDDIIQIVATGSSLSPEEYVLFPDGTAVVCSFLGPLPEGLEPYIRWVISVIASCLSLFALAATFVTYCVFPELRNTPGKSIMNLVAALFVAILLFLLSGILAQNQAACEFGAVVAHFAWMAAFLWMTMLAVDVTRTLASLVPRGTAGSSRSFAVYMAISWGVPFVIVSICVILQYCNCTSLPKIYAEGAVCWITDASVRLVVFLVPCSLCLLLNLFMFVLTVVIVRRSRHAAKAVRKQGKMKGVKAEVAIYVKVSALVGVTWVFSFLTQSVTGIVVFNYIYIILNYFQGVFIFIAFCLNKRVRGLWKTKLRGRKGMPAKGTASHPIDGSKHSSMTAASVNAKTEDTKL
ncbi:uncharacterized protein LOC119725155 [Patiria miniata]|uniref:Uncharacterized protein n=1 Tax=Patiria miniata TaxID=46514 RepID=A0A913ZM74_PATMI|nr:uncharacterized protein LOC119725155 [Patiria miniata]